MQMAADHVTVEEWTVYFEIAPKSTVIMDAHTVEAILNAGLEALGITEVTVHEIEYKDTTTP